MITVPKRRCRSASKRSGMEPLFCELYVDTDEEIEELEKAIRRASEHAFADISVEFVVYRNDDFDPSAKQRYPYSSIEASQYLAEVSPQTDLSEQPTQYQLGVARLIGALREPGRIVSASCDFEDLIAKETGWNWTRDQPEPPGEIR